MRISKRVLAIAVIGMSASYAPAFGFDGTRQPSDVAPAVSVDVVPRRAAAAPVAPLAVAPNPALPAAPVAPLGASLGLGSIGEEPVCKISAVEAYRFGLQALRAGENTRAVSALQCGAEQGLVAAQWRLGLMYADGEGVEQSDLRAFDLFSRIANSHADDVPGTPSARLVAKAFVRLGHYNLEGIANSYVRPDPARARQMYSYAASYFGDPDAQYHLARIYLDGNGVMKDPKQGVRWLGLAANKGQYQAQAMLGAMLFRGQAVPRQAARGLMWLTLGRDAASAQDDTWIKDLYDAAFKQATEDERALALVFLEQHLKIAKR
jgi:TPR repeat protein